MSPMHSECTLSALTVSPTPFPPLGTKRSALTLLSPTLSPGFPVGSLSYSTDRLFLPVFFLLMCVHPEVPHAERPCAEDPALAVGGATRGSAGPPTGRWESRCPTSSSSSRQIGARVLCQVGRTVLLALLLGQGASGTMAFPCPLSCGLFGCSSLPHPLFSVLPNTQTVLSLTSSRRPSHHTYLLSLQMWCHGP